MVLNSSVDSSKSTASTPINGVFGHSASLCSPHWSPPHVGGVKLLCPSNSTVCQYLVFQCLITTEQGHRLSQLHILTHTGSCTHTHTCKLSCVQTRALHPHIPSQSQDMSTICQVNLIFFLHFDLLFRLT